jgi:hypothetical protein
VVVVVDEEEEGLDEALQEVVVLEVVEVRLDHTISNRKQRLWRFFCRTGANHFVFTTYRRRFWRRIR